VGGKPGEFGRICYADLGQHIAVGIRPGEIETDTRL